MAWSVFYFQTTRGECPVRDFISLQDPTLTAKIQANLELLKSGGPYLRPPLVKKIASRLYEMRFTGKIPVRILYAFVDQQYYLLHAFVKKTQKIPQKELKTALGRLNTLI